MVSALTGRLFSNDGSSGPVKRKSEAVDVSSTGISSGYAADVDQVDRAIPPCFVNLQTEQGTDSNLKANANEELGAADQTSTFSSKRQKQIQKDYLALNASAELARGGLTMPKMKATCPRLLPPLCGVDMSRVVLVKSSDFDLNDYDRLRGYHDKTSNESYLQAVIGLTDACRDFYALPNEQKAPGDRTDDQSSTSSVTDSAETDTGSGNSDDDDELAKGKKYSYMTMCDALSLSKQPRVVVLSSAPYTVVYANAAFLNATGLSSMRLLGHPLQDFISDKTWVSRLNGSRETPVDLKQMHRQTVNMRTGSQKGSPLRCLIVASPIGLSHDRVTHFALGLEPFSNDRSAHVSARDEPFAPPMTISG